ncbi:MAG TPA: hypothetical protein VIG44_01415 [Thermomicrobiales bacterium]
MPMNPVASLAHNAEERVRAEVRTLLPHEVTDEGKLLLQHIREGRFQRSLALIAGFSSILSGLEVTYEHYRGSYSQRVMYTPVILSPALFAASIAGATNRKAARTVLPVVSALAVADGLVGFAFHVRGVHRKPGGWRLPVNNIVMGPPILAPVLFAVSGYLGLIAAFLRREDDPEVAKMPGARDATAPRRAAWMSLLPQGITEETRMLEHDIREGRFQKHMAAAMACAALCSGFESLYSHYENDFQYKRLQWSPIILTPIMAAAGFGAVKSRTVARTLLPAASAAAILDGTVGFFFHARGILRRPGGAKLPLYNLIYGPPAFAPLLFAASGFLGLLASLLRREEDSK